MSKEIEHTRLFDDMPVPRFIVAYEEGRYRIQEINKFGRLFFSRPKNQIIGKPLKDLLNMEVGDRLLKGFENAYATSEPVSVTELQLFPGDFEVPGFWICPIEQNGGVLFDVIAQPPAYSDTALQRERDDALLLLTSIFDTSEVGIIVTDHNRRIIKVNDSFVRIYGWERDELVGHDFVDIIAAEDREWARKNHEQFIREGVRSTGEMRVTRKNGGIANTLVTTATLELSNNRRFQVTTVTDITMRKQMELSLRKAKEQADSANHAKSSFLANMSHELRTPLNAIIGFSEMIMNETFGPVGHAKYKEYLGDVHLSARHLLEIINEVLDMSKIEAGRVELDEKLVDMPVLLDSVTRIMLSRAFSSGLEIVQNVDKNLPGLYADPRLIRQIVINLVTNALKYSKEGGKIIITANIDDHKNMRIVVKDEGVGIAEDRLEEALEPFSQVSDPVESRGFQGTGLGLPLAKAMTELHDGKLTLESSLGQGTTVTLIFPKDRVNAHADDNPLQEGIELQKSS